MTMIDLTADQKQRYARHTVMPEIGEAGQATLLRSRVLVVGAGGLGSPLLLYLAAAGVGTIGVIDDDVVDRSNLQRQVIHDEAHLGVAKVESVAKRLHALNSDVQVDAMQTRLTAANALDLVSRYDIIADATDNFATRFLLNDACFLAQRTLVSAAVIRFDAQISTYKAYQGAPHPCYRCLLPAPPPADAMPGNAALGIIGALAGIGGAFQAIEVIKELLTIGEGLSGSLTLIDTLGADIRRVAIRRNPACPLCGAHPSITDLSPHDHKE